MGIKADELSRVEDLDYGAAIEAESVLRGAVHETEATLTSLTHLIDNTGLSGASADARRSPRAPRSATHSASTSSCPRVR
jgi:hypothetical protein